MGAAVQYLRDERNVFFLALEAQEPVGFLRGTVLRQIHTERPQMFLYEIGVAPAHRRQGIGRSLIRALIAHCQDRGFDEIFVLTDPANSAAVSLYQSTGGRPETPADRMFVYHLDAPRRPSPKRS